MTVGMTDLGFTNKDLSDSSYYGSPCCPSENKDDWEKQVVYPEIRFNGKVAEALGVEDLDLDETVELTVVLRVKGLRNEGRVVEGKKKKDVEVCFEVISASDMTPVGEAKEEDGDEGSGEKMTMGAQDDDEPVNAIL